MTNDTTTTETTPAPNKYVTHFNAVVGNYAEALLVDGQGSERHKRAAQALDNLMRENALATELLDHVRHTLCFVKVERAYNEGRDYLALADSLAAEYPPLADAIQAFVGDLLPASSVTP